MTVTKTYYHRSRSYPSTTYERDRGYPRKKDDRGEGVISAAIAVLIMAFIGVGMWVAFDKTFEHTANNVNNQVNCIGQSGSNC